MRRLSRILLFAIFVLAACNPRVTETTGGDATLPAEKQPTPIPPPSPGQGLSTLAGQIIKHPEWYAGQTVTLVGYFRGLDLLDEVVLDPPSDRLNHWVIADDSGAIWVTYADKLPFPPTSHEVWRIVRVRGQVGVYKSGMPYIEPLEVQWEGLTENYDVLPALCRVAIHRFGGPDQLDHHIYWYDTGSLAVIDTKADWRGSVKLKKGEIYDLSVAFDKAKFFEVSPTVGNQCQGCIRYYIAAVNEKEGAPHFVTAYQGTVPERLQAFIDLMVEKTAEAKPIQ